MTRRFAWLTSGGLLCAVMQGALADTATTSGCDVHAAAMVAEMKAGAATPMSDQEVALVRETARKSCLAQQAGGGAAAAVAAPAPAVASVAAAPVAKASHDNSFFGTLGAIFSGPTERKPGNQRLLDRSQH